MLFQLPTYHQNKGEEVRFYFAISTCIYLCYLYFLCGLVLICIYLRINTYKYINNEVMLMLKKQTHVLFPLFNNTDDYLLYWHTQKNRLMPKLVRKWTVAMGCMKKMYPLLSVCNFQSMKSPMEPNSLLSKSFCCITLLVISPD